MNVPEPTQEMITFFTQRTDQHIQRVINNMNLMDGFKNISLQTLQERGAAHDQSKYEEPERLAYIWLTWYHKQRKDGVDIEYPDGVQEAVNKAIKHHTESNRHHSEAHTSVNDMSCLDVVEMVCDWTAISQEYGADTCLAWVEANVSKFGFNDDMLAFIYETISELNLRLGVDG